MQKKDRYKQKTDVQSFSEHLPEASPPGWMMEMSPPSFNTLEARAKYIEQFGEDWDRDRLDLLIAAEQASFIDNLSELLTFVSETYPKRPLELGEKRYEATPDARAKARFLNVSICKLLEFMDAPRAMRLDLDVLLSSFPVDIVMSRSRAQRELLLDDSAPRAAVARRAKVDRNDLRRWIKAGLVIDPFATRRTAGRVPRPRRGGKTLP